MIKKYYLNIANKYKGFETHSFPEYINDLRELDSKIISEYFSEYDYTKGIFCQNGCGMFIYTPSPIAIRSDKINLYVHSITIDKFYMNKHYTCDELIINRIIG